MRVKSLCGATAEHRRRRCDTNPMPMPFEEMAGVFDIELHDVDETVDVDSEDDAIQVEEVCTASVTKFLCGLVISRNEISMSSAVALSKDKHICVWVGTGISFS